MDGLSTQFPAAGFPAHDAREQPAGRLAWVWTLLPLACLGYLLAEVRPRPVALPRSPGLPGLPGLIEWGVALLCVALVLLGFGWMSQAGGGAMRRARRPMTAALAALLGLGLLGIAAGPTPGPQAGEWLQAAFVSIVTVYLLGAFLLRRALVRDAPAPARPWPQTARDYAQMTKPGLNGLVLTTTLIGYTLASSGAFDGRRCAWALAGTALTAAGSSTLNQFMERDVDARMARTAGRPLPAGRLTPGAALGAGVAMAAAGLWVLAGEVNILTAFLGALTLANYLFLYTPLKRISTLSTLAGCISGAIPPVMGWTAAGGTLAPTAQVLFFILFLWQVPHFLAIAWKYRDQYRAAGCPLYAVLDEGGAATARQAVLYTAALAAVSVLPWGYGLTGPLYGVGALALGAAFLAAGVRFLRERTTPNAMRLFFTSIIYLPLLLALLMIDVRV